MEVNFHLPGLRQNFPLNMLVVGLLKQKPELFREGIRIASFFGEFPMSLFNGGRPSNYDQCSADYIRQVIRTLDSQNIMLRYTYTNMTLTEEELKDPYCNFCLKEAHSEKNGVILFSPLLEEYIRKNYPKYKITSSTCKELRTIEEVNAELEKDYHIVVLDYNLNNQFDQLEQIKDKARCEILVNSLCIPNCPRRGAHYENVARNQRIELANRKLPKEQQKPREPWSCQYGEHNRLFNSRSYVTHVSPDDIYEKYLPMGFNNFKLEGRTANIFSLVETYCYYLIKPEHQMEARLLLLDNLAANKVLTVNRLRPGRWP
ncbi:MAG: hypothetical protein KBT01_10260 [Clostridiales bacterium]|nr:hypothetical protein [Candidatus Blautia equi]